MFKRILVFILTILFTMSLFGCSEKRTVVDTPEVTKAVKTDEINADIYIDGTYSMAGYVNYPTTTVYSDSLKDLERTIASTWKKETVQYIKFGDSYQILNREQFLQSDKPVFYEQVNTNLQNVINDTDLNKLNIIVTDLFQTNQDIESLMLSIKQKYVSNDNKAIAIIGAKSQFNGRIYDIGKSQSYVDYVSTENSSSYRPFYILVLGNEVDVRSFTEAYKKNNENKKELKIAMYSKNIGIDSYFEQDTNAKNVKENGERLKQMAKISNLLEDDSHLQFRLNLDEGKSKADLVLQSNGVIAACPDEYSVVIEKVEKWENTDSNKDKESGNLLDKVTGKNKKEVKANYDFKEISAKNFIVGETDDLKIENNTIKMPVTLKIDPLGINKREGVYRVNVVIVPEQDEYIESMEVFNEWSVDDNQISAESNLSDIGSKTLNISKFTEMLANLNYQMNTPGFYDLYVYLDAKK